jgi:site-specific DNA-methyltransferase (adenine-specific)
MRARIGRVEPELEIVEGENLSVLRGLEDGAFQLVYVDPPFNTGRSRRLKRLRTERDPGGDRVGFGGERYRSRVLSERSFEDAYDDYLAFLRPRLEEAVRVLDATGSLFVHVDPRESHYVKVFLDELLGRDRFQN